MSSYNSSFSYLGKNSATDFKWIISHFDADSGESETGLSTESIYTASADGTSRNLYGTKYSGPEPVRITVIKQGGGDWTIGDNRQALKWLTGAKSDSWLDLYIGDEVRYRMLGHVQNVLQYKMDARIVGLVIVFESASPFAFSSPQIVSKYINGEDTFDVDNPSDDNYTFVKMKTSYANSKGTSVTIVNETTDEITQISNLVANEMVTLNSNQSIISDKPGRVFGNNFNFIFPRLAPGTNKFTVIGTGNITFEYSYFIKIGDMATDINAVSDRICDDFGNIQLDMLDWSRVSNTPNTLSGYGITDAYPASSVYNKNEINDKMGDLKDIVDSTASLISNISSDLANDYYDKADIDSMLENFTQADVYTKSEIDEKFANMDVPEIDAYTKAEVDKKFDEIYASDQDTYTKAEIDEKLNNITASGVDISERELDNMLTEVLGE